LEGISIGYFAVLLVGFGLWVSYGIASHDLPLVVPN
jgi:MtN3 and saliva related transmembrane protein